MIEVSADIIAINENLIKIITCNIPKNNISKNITYLFNQKNNGSNPFLLGVSKLGSTAKLSSLREKYYIGSHCSDSNGDFDTPYLITITGKDIQNISIQFDTYNNQFPRTIIVNGQLYNCESPTFRIIIDKTDKIEIIIDNWNTPYYPLRIQSINSFYVSIDLNNLKSLSNSIFDRANIELPSYGIISNVGKVEFIDAHGVALYYLNNELLNDNSKARMRVNSQQVGVFNVYDWEYDSNDKVVKVNLQDNLTIWQSITVDNIYYNFEHPETQSLKYFYNHLKSISEQYGFEFEPLDSETEEILNNTIVKYVFLKSDTLWNEWYKLCKAALLYIYKNNDNKVVVIHKI